MQPGALVDGRYEIRELLGRGGMGVVYKAHDRLLEETVALKVLRGEAASSDLARRFREEIRLARRVSHRNVCRIHEYGEEGSLRYISMAYVDGVDLKRILRERGPLPAGEALDVAQAVCAGLQAIHDEGIVHRDLKTANIMRDSKGVVRLMDFGIAKDWSAGTAAGLTSVGMIVGTPEYMSPEQVQGSRVDARSDLYAMGIVVYELLTGRVPFRGDTPMATLLRHVQEPLRLDTAEAAVIPAAVRPVLERALAKFPDARFASAREMGEALAAAQRVLAPTHRPPILATAIPELAPTPIPAPTAVPALAPTRASAPTVSIAGTTPTPVAARAPRAVAPGPAAAVRPRWLLLAIAAAGVLVVAGAVAVWVVWPKPVPAPFPGPPVLPSATQPAAPPPSLAAASPSPETAPPPSAVHAVEAPAPRMPVSAAPATPPRPSPAPRAALSTPPPSLPAVASAPPAPAAVADAGAAAAASIEQRRLEGEAARRRLLSPPDPASLGRLRKAAYVGGTLPDVGEGTPGSVAFPDREKMVFLVAGGSFLVVPYRGVSSIEYGLTNRIRGLVFKKKSHYVSLTYQDAAGETQGMVLELGQDDFRPVLTMLEARTGKQVQYQDEQAAKARWK